MTGSGRAGRRMKNEATVDRGADCHWRTPPAGAHSVISRVSFFIAPRHPNMRKRRRISVPPPPSPPPPHPPAPSVKHEMGARSALRSVANVVHLQALASTDEYSLKSIKTISDEDRSAGRTRNQREKKEKEEEGGTRKRKKTSIADAARADVGRTPVDQDEQTTQTQINDVIQTSEFQLKLRALTSQYPIYDCSLDSLTRGECSQSALMEIVNTPRPVVPLRLAGIESKMLKEAGRWWEPEVQKEVVFPACNRGALCLTSSCYTSVEGLQEPVVLMAAMNEDQYDQLLHDGESPSDFSSMCVLCNRFVVESIIHEHRALVMNHRATINQQPDHGLLDVVRPIQVCYNLKDEIGGYKAAHMREPRFGDLIVQPIANTALSLLTASRDRRTGRTAIDQSGIVYHPVVEAVEPGMQVRDFCTRSRKAPSASRLRQLEAEQRGARLRDRVRAFLLQNQTDPAVRLLGGGTETIDCLRCEQYCCDVNISRKLSFVASQLLEAIRYLQEKDPNKYLSMRRIPFAELENDPGCWASVSTDIMLDHSLMVHMCDAAFFSPLTDVAVAILHVITKCVVNARCQCRTFGSMLRQKLVSIKRERRTRKKGKQPRVEETTVETYCLRVCKEMILCALLGNFAHSNPSTRPSSVYIRSFLRKLFTENLYDRWVVRLLQRCPLALVYCVRTTMVSVLEHNPALLRHVYSVMNFPKFREVTETAMDILRVRMAEYILNPMSSLHDSLRTLPSTPCSAVHLYFCGHKTCSIPGVCSRRKTVGNYTVSDDLQREIDSGWVWTEHPLHTELNMELQPFEDVMKRFSYRRPPHVAKLLRPMRSEFKLVPYQRVVGSLQEEDEDEEEGEEEEEETKEERSIDRYLFPTSKSSPYLPDSHLLAARAVVAHCGPVGHGNPFPRVLDFLPCFGVSEECTAELQELFRTYEHHLQPGQQIQRRLWALRNTQPHAYNLIHVFSELLEQAQRRMRMVELPLHILQAQIDALQRSCEISDPTTLLNSSIAFVFCHVCLRIYSHIRDVNSVFSNTYNVGLLDPSVSYVTKKAYCKNHRTNHRGTCGEEELIRIPILGRVLFFGRKIVMICPQKNCGALFALDPKEESYVYSNERGPACPTCSKSRGIQSAETRNKALRALYVEKELRCYYCPERRDVIKEAWSAHMYGRDNYLCRKHHNPLLNETMKRELLKVPLYDYAQRDRCIDSLLEMYKKTPPEEEEIRTARAREWIREDQDLLDRVVSAKMEEEEEEEKEMVWE